MDELEERQRVWLALSDLFLDTDVSLSFDHIERELGASSFSMEEIDAILRDEVAPVCLPNLYQVAGEWAGFHHGWLIPAIERHMARPAWRRQLGGFLRDVQLRQMVPEWPALRARVVARRGG